MASSSDVTGKRILAWLIDAFGLAAISVGLLTALGRSGTFPNSADATEYCDIQSDIGADVVCFNAGSSVFEWDTSQFGLVALLWLVLAILNHVVLQGITGASVGKRLAGLRVVGEDSTELAGFGPNVVRFLLWIIDGIPFVVPFFPLPLLGGILMLTSDKKQRLGDRVAKTRVIDASHVGANATEPMSPATVGLEWAQPMPGETLENTATFNPPATPPTPAPETSWAPPNPTDQAPAPQPDVTTQMPMQTAPAPTPEPAPATPPWEEPTTAIPAATPPDAAPEPTPDSEPVPEAAPAPAPEPEAESRPGIDAPMWDEARGTHIQWDPKLAKWMGWDQAESRWKPL